MENDQKSPSDFEILLGLKERELLLQRDSVWKFVETGHKAKTTKEYQNQVRKSGLEISAILFSLLELQESSQFKDAAKVLCERCRGLENYTRDMNKSLADDLAEKQKTEDENKIDVIKTVTFIFAIPAGFMTAIKGGLFHGHVDIDQAAEAGFAVSVSVVSCKGIKHAFKSLANSLCKKPEQIRNSFMLYYARETLRQTATEGMSSLRNGAGLLSREVSLNALRARRVMKRNRNGHKPIL